MREPMYILERVELTLEGARRTAQRATSKVHTAQRVQQMRTCALTFALESASSDAGRYLQLTRRVVCFCLVNPVDPVKPACECARPCVFIAVRRHQAVLRGAGGEEAGAR